MEINSRIEKNAKERGNILGISNMKVTVLLPLSALMVMISSLPAHGDVAVAAVVLEALKSEEERDEGNMVGVHGLEGEPYGGAVEVCIVHELLDGLQNLLQEGALHETEFQHLDDDDQRVRARKRVFFCDEKRKC